MFLSTGNAPGDLISYRGYYSDLAFEPGDRCVTVKELLERANEANGDTFTGYKGGDFVMGDDTPLWAAPYGSTGLAIVDIKCGDDVELICKNLDD